MDYELTQVENGTEIFAEAQTGNKQWVAIISDTHPKYNYDRDFVAYQKPKTSKRFSGREVAQEGDVIEMVRYTHSGKNDTRLYYQLVGGELHEIDESEITLALEETIVETAPEPRDVDFDSLESCVTEVHSCEECGRSFDTAHGLATHTGIVHADDTEPNAADSTPNTEIAADGGVEIEGYDIDPTELELIEERKSSQRHDNVATIVGQIKDTNIWVVFRESQVGPREYAQTIKGIGRLSIKPKDLDPDPIAEKIREEAERWLGEDTDDDIEVLVEQLTTQADEIAAKVIEQWQFGADEVIDNALWEGAAAVDGTTVWASHVPEAIGTEVEWSLRDLDIEDTDDRIGLDTVRQAFYDGAIRKQLRDRWRAPHAEYMAKLEFEIEPWELRAIELEQNSVLPAKTAEVVALTEEGHRQGEIADRLDITQSTVSRQLTRAKDLRQSAMWTVQNIDL